MTVALNSSKGFISIRATSKSVFKKIGPLYEIAKFVNFIVYLGIV